MIRVAFGALPVRVGLGGCGAAKSIALREAPGLSIAAFLFLDLGKQQTKATLGWSLSFRYLNLVTSFAGQSSVKGDPGQKQLALKIVRIASSKALRCLGPRQFIRFQGERETRKIGMRYMFPCLRDTRLGPPFMAN